ncbi:unnamed protein product [Prunus armeniaca]
MSLQPRVDHLTKHTSDAPGKPARCLPSKVKELLRKKCLSDSFWNKMIVISCVIAISLDPLFLYIPFIDEGKRCLGMDRRLWNVALILQSLTDITFVVDIGYQIYEGLNQAYKVINGRKSDWHKDWQPTLITRDEIIPFAKIFVRDLTWRPLVTDLLSVFPMPQLLVKVFFKIWWSGYSEPRKIVNFFLLIQYLPRIYRIILSSSELTRTITIHVKAIFNFFLYILASHVIGAFWYFFSIQRETFCWHQACQNQTNPGKCMSTFYCDHNNTAEPNITFFDEHCNIDVPYNAAKPFKYGIFLDSLKSGIAGNSSTFPTKLCYSFWWGLRNLSNFGTNLATSNYMWENLFAILISITGLLLFVYLIGNVQVELLKLMNDSVLNMMCDCLTRVTYAVDHIIFSKGHPIDRMLLIIEGTVLTYSITPIPSLTRSEETTKDSGAVPSPSTSVATKKLEERYVYGEELLTWASPNNTGMDNLPTSNENVKCHTKVEGFALSAKDLHLVVSKCKMWKLNFDP